MQRLTNLCSVLNDMEPICVLNHVFVLREVKHFIFSFSLSLHLYVASSFAWMISILGQKL